MRSYLPAVLLLAVSVVLTACGSDPEPTEPTEEVEAAVTYERDIRPILQQNCVGCHESGGIGPYRLDTYEDVVSTSSLALDAMESGRMPPWMPDPDCRRYRDERLMADEEIATFREWIELGHPQGAPVDSTDSETPANADEAEPLGEPDMVLKPSDAYQPTIEAGDEYRCFLLEGEFPDDTFLEAVDIHPGHRGLVHHANLFLISGDSVPVVDQLSAEDDQAGYDCFGDTGVATLDLIAAWVPGAGAIRLDDGTGVHVPKGARFVLQTHFNSLYSDLEPVLTTAEIHTLDDTPDLTARAMPIANLQLDIEPGDASSSHTIEVRNLSDQPWDVFGAAAHMHLLGSSVRLDVLHTDGTEECLLDIPEWDFNWQQAYFFRDGDRTQVEPGASVRLTCEFDNSPENQPFIDGERMMPQPVGWGGGTLDEMCLAFLPVARPFDPALLEETELCETFKSCRSGCEDPYSVGCVVTCGTAERTCGECLLGATQRCASTHCPDELRAATPCLLTCAQGAQAGGDIDQCLQDNCPEQRVNLESCMRPVIEGGFCDQNLADCNVSLGQ